MRVICWILLVIFFQSSLNPTTPLLCVPLTISTLMLTQSRGPYLCNAHPLLSRKLDKKGNPFIHLPYQIFPTFFSKLNSIFFCRQNEETAAFCMQKVFNECKSINYKLIRIPDKSKCKKDQKDFCPKRGLGYLP